LRHVRDICNRSEADRVAVIVWADGRVEICSEWGPYPLYSEPADTHDEHTVAPDIERFVDLTKRALVRAKMEQL
jgi:hypothetical protein